MLHIIHRQHPVFRAHNACAFGRLLRSDAILLLVFYTNVPTAPQQVAFLREACAAVVPPPSGLGHREHHDDHSNVEYYQDQE